MQLADAYSWLPWEVERVEDEYPGFLGELAAYLDARSRGAKPKPLGKQIDQDDEDD